MSTAQPSTRLSTQIPGTWVARLPMMNGRRVLDASVSAEGDLAIEGNQQAFVAGVLHNRAQLDTELRMRNEESDAAMIIAAYRRWGEDFLGRLEGVFALVVWDEDAEKLIVARDALGSYPVFYAEGGGHLYVSNSIDTLLEQPGVPDAVNLPALADHLRHRWPHKDETYFEAVRRVPAGHALIATRGGRRMQRHWDPAPAGEVDWVGADELERFDSLFEQSVGRCLAHGPAGIFLSGGLDSVSVAAVATASCRRDIRPDPWALSLAFPHPDCNEESVQRGVAETLGLPQVILSFKDASRPKGLIQGALDVSSVSPAPLVSLWEPAYNRLALEGKSRGCAVILTGGGGDEWLTVSQYYAADLLRAGDVRSLYRLFQEHRRSHQISSPAYLRSVLWRFGGRPLLLDRIRRLAPSLFDSVRARRIRAGTPDWIAPDARLRRTLFERNGDRATDPERTAKRPGKRSHPQIYIREMRTALDHPLVSMELEGYFEQGRRLGMRIMQPFWDAALVDFLYRTPPELLNRGGRAKGLVRESVARRFPTLGFDTQRKVLATRFAQSLVLEQGRQAWKEIGGASALADAGVVDGATLSACMTRILDDPNSRDFHVVWNVLASESWLRARVGTR